MMKNVALISLFLALPFYQLSGQERADELEDAVDQVRAAKVQEEDLLNQAITDLQETVVTGSRIEEDPFEFPGSIVRRNGRELDRRVVPSTFPDAFRRLPGVAVQKTGPGLGSPFIRGLTGFRTALTIDGIRLNHSAFRDGPNQYWATVDTLGLDRIEVLNGPAGVLYGSDAAGGVAAAFTAPVDLGEEGATDFSGRAYYRYNSAENSHIARGEVGVSDNGVFGARIGATYKSFGDTNAGGSLGRQNGLAYDAYFLDAKFRYVASDMLAFELLIQSGNLNNAPRNHSTVNGVSFNGTTIGSDLRREFDQERDLVLLTTSLFDGSFFEEATFKIGYQRHDELQNRVRSSGRLDRSGFELETFFFTTQFHTDSAAGRLVYGLDLYVDWVDSFSTRFTPGTGAFTSSPQGPIGDGSNYLTLGLYIEDTIELGNWGRLALGARYTHVSVNSDTVLDPITNLTNDFDDSFDAIVGSAKLIVDVMNEMRAYGSANMGFRAPNLSDLTRFDSARTDEIEIPSTDLDPEFFLGLELGANWRSDTVRAHGAVFYTFLFDSIVRSPTGALIGNEFAITKSNAKDGYIWGLEGNIAWDISSEFTLSGQVSWIDGRIETFPTSAPISRKEPPSRLTPMQGLVALDYAPNNTGFHARAEAEFVAKANDVNTRDSRDTQRIPAGGTPKYALFNLRFDYTFEPEKVVFLHFENLTDKNYRVHGSGSQEAGFSIIAGFDMSF